MTSWVKSWSKAVLFWLKGGDDLAHPLIGISVVLLLALLSSGETYAADILNPGFEDDWAGWTDGDPTGSATGISDVAHSGNKSVKLTQNGAYVSQTIAVQPNTTYRLSAFLRGPGNVGAKVGTDLFFEQQPKKGKKWREVVVTFNSGASASVYVFGSCAGVEVRMDDFSLESLDTTPTQTSPRIISSRAGGYGLSPDLPPGKNFDLLGWYLSVPTDVNKDRRSDQISEIELAKGAEDERYFYTGDDGGMVFRAPIAGAKTSTNTRFTRTELREMLRRGNQEIRTKTDDGSPNKNNWVLSSAPKKALTLAGGVDGKMQATLAVNHVTTTGDPSQVGRVIVGQIHAKGDEPIRLYYRKLPGNTRGAIYAAHEPVDRDDIYFELIGERGKSVPDPEDGIALDEKFSYSIETNGNLLYVTISQNDQLRAEQTIDMTDSGYDVADDYMYFKAGVYNQNNSGDPDDYVQATFYELNVNHNEYEH